MASSGRDSNVQQEAMASSGEGPKQVAADADLVGLTGPLWLHSNRERGALEGAYDRLHLLLSEWAAHPTSHFLFVQIRDRQESSKRERQETERQAEQVSIEGVEGDSIAGLISAGPGERVVVVNTAEGATMEPVVAVVDMVVASVEDIMGDVPDPTYLLDTALGMQVATSGLGEERGAVRELHCRAVPDEMALTRADKADGNRASAPVASRKPPTCTASAGTTSDSTRADADAAKAPPIRLRTRVSRRASSMHIGLTNTHALYLQLLDKDQFALGDIEMILTN
ncbi:hypothetical protein OE88DRAFT_1640721 [Heliocybe sulcata]|uniref:Uncharacterized protein n=1 Tax=Heliocybe sulcata TaxID=5364 RepID=A0A5C3NHN2_9AGAM|nr:hypothetical protein OE88DRAFT_1640721 [Heliocybe sulcata]